MSMPEQLDKSQLQFCESPGKNIRLLAPAGCGKTLSLLFRCKALSERAKPQRPRFLIVTFTVAARQELASRLNSDDRFGTLRDAAEITTLNSWGFRRIKNVAAFPKLITSKTDYHFAMLNQLQPVCKSHEKVKSAIEQSQATAPRLLMDAI